MGAAVREMTDEEVFGPAKKEMTDEEVFGTYAPTVGMSGFQKAAAGAGKALTDLGRGAGQLIGAVSRKDIDESRRRDAALMETGAGKAGFIGGGLIPLSALALVPGANTVAGSAALGAATGALEPVGSDDSRLSNIALGGAFGGGSAAALKGAGIGARTLLSKSRTALAGAASRNSVRDATLKAAQAEGYVLPPSIVDAGMANKALESIGGKAATGQEAAIRNQQITNTIARREAGLAENDPISERTLEAARNVIAAPYREVAALSPRAITALEEMKAARNEAKLHWREYNVSQKVSALKEAQRLDLKAKAYERLIDSEAMKVGRADLLPALKNARVALAKNYDIEKALNIGNGNVDAHVIGRMLDKRGEDALSGGLLTIGKFSEAFPHFAREASGVPSPGVSKLAPYAGVALGAIGGGASEYTTGTPYGAVAAALPLLSGPARSLALSKMMRPRPSYNPGKSLRMADFATNNPRLRAMIPLGAVESVLNPDEQ